MKDKIFALLLALGSYFSYLIGGWSAGMTTLAIFMGADYLTGILVAGIFKNSPKSQNGALESRAGFKGLLRKGTILLIVLIAHRLDIALSVSFIKDGVIVAYMFNEAVSVMENITLMGLPVPEIIKKAIDILGRENEQNL